MVPRLTCRNTSRVGHLETDEDQIRSKSYESVAAIEQRRLRDSDLIPYWFHSISFEDRRSSKNAQLD
jgi:hypothetical protein